MGKIKRTQSGQAIIIMAFAMMGLFAMVGLAVDGGMAFSDRRAAQNAADAAALAGAVAKVEGAKLDPAYDGDDPYDYWSHAAWDSADRNGYHDDIVNSEVYVWSCGDVVNSSCGYYAGKPDYVQVIIETNINTFFARVIGITQTHNRVEAIALADDDDSGPLYNAENIIALSTQCENPDNFIVEGNADVTITDNTGGVASNGGLYVNTSDPACGFTCNTSAGTITADITSAGGSFDPSAHCDANHTGSFDNTGEQWDFPVYLEDMGIDVPSECDAPVGTYHNYPGGYTYGTYPTISGPVTVLTPGKYADFPPKKEQPLGNLYDTIYMQPGVYCVNNVVKLTTTNLTLIGYDVTFFIRAGYTFNMNGGKIQIDAPDDGAYAGYLMILEPDYTGYPDTWSSLNCTITGSSLNIYRGAIFAPSCNVTVNGADPSDTSSGVVGIESQIIAYTVKINGNKDINFSYDADENPVTNAPARVGQMH